MTNMSKEGQALLEDVLNIKPGATPARTWTEWHGSLWQKMKLIAKPYEPKNKRR